MKCNLTNKKTVALFAAGKYNEQIKIENNATGYSYERVFGRLIDESLTEVEVQDPYIRSIHQVCAACVFVCVCLTVVLIISLAHWSFNRKTLLDEKTKAQRLISVKCAHFYLICMHFTLKCMKCAHVTLKCTKHQISTQIC